MRRRLFRPLAKTAAMAMAMAAGWGAPGVAWASGTEAASAVSSGASAAIPFRTVGDAHAPAPSEWGLAILVCVVALVVLVAVLKRYGRQLRVSGFGTKEVQILEKSPLGPGTHLVVVAYRGRRLLLATGASHTRCLRDDPLEPAHPASALKDLTS